MKKLLKIFAVLVVLGVLAVIGLGFGIYIYKDTLVGVAVERALAHVLDVNVSLGKIKLSLKESRVDLYDLRIGNPPGYETPEALSFAHVGVGVDVASLRPNFVSLTLLEVDKPRIYLEYAQKKWNLNQLMENTERFVEATLPEEIESGGGTSEEIHVHIAKVRITEANMNVKAPLLPKQAGITLPTVEINDIGTKNKPVSIAKAVAAVLGALMEQALVAVTDVLPTDLLGQGAEQIKEGLGGVADDLIKGVTGEDGGEGTAEGIKEGLKGLFKRD